MSERCPQCYSHCKCCFGQKCADTDTANAWHSTAPAEDAPDAGAKVTEVSRDELDAEVKREMSFCAPSPTDRELAEGIAKREGWTYKNGCFYGRVQIVSELRLSEALLRTERARLEAEARPRCSNCNAAMCEDCAPEKVCGGCGFVKSQRSYAADVLDKLMAKCCCHADSEMLLERAAELRDSNG